MLGAYITLKLINEDAHIVVIMTIGASISLL